MFCVVSVESIKRENGTWVSRERMIIKAKENCRFYSYPDNKTVVSKSEKTIFFASKIKHIFCALLRLILGQEICLRLTIPIWQGKNHRTKPESVLLLEFNYKLR